jgi:hypothetical protein
MGFEAVALHLWYIEVLLYYVLCIVSKFPVILGCIGYVLFFVYFFQGTQRSKKQSPFAGSPVRSRTRDYIVPREESNAPIGRNITFS